jgi:hypothetical protein
MTREEALALVRSRAPKDGSTRSFYDGLVDSLEVLGLLDFKEKGPWIAVVPFSKAEKIYFVRENELDLSNLEHKRAARICGILFETSNDA